jgi:hypothetical protein
MESPPWQHITVFVFNDLREKFVTWRNNGILPTINEFARPHQSKNNGIYAAYENGELSSLLMRPPGACKAIGEEFLAMYSAGLLVAGRGTRGRANLNRF